MSAQTTVMTKLSSKNQTVVPLIVREALNLQSGSQVLWSVEKVGGQLRIALLPKPARWSDHIMGLGKEIWQDEPADQYIRKLRDEWKTKNDA